MTARADIELKGLRELQAQILGLAASLTAEAQQITDETAAEVAGEVKAAYQEGPTGNLRKGVKVQKRRGTGHRAMSSVVSTAPHAHLYEYGTAVRRQPNGKNVGSMPGRPVLGTTAARLRRRMQDKLEAMVARETGAETRRVGGAE